MQERIRKLLVRLSEVEELLGRPDILADQKKYREITQEHSYLAQVRDASAALERIDKQLEENRELIKNESDPEFLEVIRVEIALLEKERAETAKQLENLLVPPNPNDSRNTIVEIRAGTGGDEAAIFVGDLVRMYMHYADSKGWKTEPISVSESEMGGYKECSMIFSGQDVHRLMQYEAGTHRVQRVPKTEAQGRVHTSAVTVAVLMEPDELEKVEFDEKDLRIDTYRSSGAGGQHVNTTDSAVRITHLPTGTVVYCQEERSQHKNKDKAMRLLGAKIAEEQRRKAHAEIASLRQSQVGSGDRSERIRTYNFPQNRVTDHRIDLTLYKLDKVMEGDLDEIAQALVAHFHKEELSGE